MLRNRWIWVTVCVVMGALQAWDSGTLRAPGLIQATVALAIAVPAIAMVATTRYGLHALSVAASFVLLTVARMVSPVSLPTLHIVAFIPAVIVFFSHLTEGRHAQA